LSADRKIPLFNKLLSLDHLIHLFLNFNLQTCVKSLCVEKL